MGKRQPSRIPRAFLCAALGVASVMCFVVDTEGYVGMSALPAASTSYLWSAPALCFALLLLFNPLGESKYDALQMDNTFAGTRPTGEEGAARLKWVAAQTPGLSVRVG